MEGGGGVNMCRSYIHVGNSALSHLDVRARFTHGAGFIRWCGWCGTRGR